MSADGSPERGDQDHPDGEDRGRLERAVSLALGQVAAGAPAAVLADRLAGAAAGVVGMDAGGVSVLFAPQMSVPVGISDPAAETAERLQFTTGEGPCWATFDTGAAMVVDDLGAGPGELAPGRGPTTASTGGAARSAAARQWPAYAVEVFRATSFRGVASLPLPVAAGVPVVLNLYSRSPLPDLGVGAGALLAVARGVGRALQAASSPGGPGGGRAWLESSSTRRRAQVWVAEELLVRHAPHLDAVAALAAMRTYCAVEGGTVDDVADALVGQALDPARVLGQR